MNGSQKGFGFGFGLEPGFGTNAGSVKAGFDTAPSQSGFDTGTAFDCDTGFGFDADMGFGFDAMGFGFDAGF